MPNRGDFVAPSSYSHGTERSRFICLDNAVNVLAFRHRLYRRLFCFAAHMLRYRGGLELGGKAKPTKRWDRITTEIIVTCFDLDKDFRALGLGLLSSAFGLWYMVFDFVLDL